MIKGEFHNVDINLGYERLAKAIVVGGLRGWNYKFLASDWCLDLCLMVDWDRDELVRKLRKVEKREGPCWWKLRRTCDDCEKPIADWNKSGYCKLCAKSHRKRNDHNYGRARMCLKCGGRITNNARLCRTCENKRRRSAGLDGGGQAVGVHENCVGEDGGVRTQGHN